MHVSVLGAGTMGHGIAQVTTMAGNDVQYLTQRRHLIRFEFTKLS